MKPTGKHIKDVQEKIDNAVSVRKLSYADIAKLSNVDQSQVSRICRGHFKTFSNNVVQVCRVLDVRVPDILREMAADAEWEKAQASMRRIWERTPDAAIAVTRVLDAIADLQESAHVEAAGPATDGNSGS
jgi:DNA-binding Xre family transcriptional regulator